MWHPVTPSFFPGWAQQQLVSPGCFFSQKTPQQRQETRGRLQNNCCTTPTPNNDPRQRCDVDQFLFSSTERSFFLAVEWCENTVHNVSVYLHRKSSSDSKTQSERNSFRFSSTGKETEANSHNSVPFPCALSGRGNEHVNVVNGGVTPHGVPRQPVQPAL